MKLRITPAVIAAGLILLSVRPVSADDSLLRARATAGYSSYALTLTGSGSSSPDATSNYFSLGAGLTYATGNIFFDGYYSSSLGAEHDWPGYEGDFERTDMALTIGYLLDKGWSVFGGYKSGKSILYQDNLPGYSLTFEAYGPFGGASKSFPLTNGASFLMSGAIAYMTGDVYDNSTVNDSGTAVGLSIAATYNRPFSQTAGLQLRGSTRITALASFRRLWM